MHPQDAPPRLGAQSVRTGRRNGGLLGRAFAAIAGAAVLALALVFSVVVFSVLLVGGLVVVGYLWWRTRELRRQVRAAMEQQAQAPPPGGRVIDGEVIRD